MTSDRAVAPVAFASLAATALSVLAFGGNSGLVVFAAGLVLIGAITAVIAEDGKLVAPLPVLLAISMGALGLAQVLPLPHVLPSALTMPAWATSAAATPLRRRCTSSMSAGRSWIGGANPRLGTITI